MTFTDEGAEVTLKSGQTVTLKNLPNKTSYTVTEKQAEYGYETTITKKDGSNAEEASGVIAAGWEQAKDDNNASFQFKNTWTKGALEVTKTMGGPAAAGERVTFEIELDLSKADLRGDKEHQVDYDELVNWIGVKDTKIEAGKTEADYNRVVKTSLDKETGKYTITVIQDVKLDGGNTIVTLDTVPTGVTYTVTETTERLAEDGYEVLYRVNDEVDQTVGTGLSEREIDTDGQTDTIRVTDFRNVGNVSISKKLLGDSAEKDKAFNFDISVWVPKTAQTYMTSGGTVTGFDGTKLEIESTYAPAEGESQDLTLTKAEQPEAEPKDEIDPDMSVDPETELWLFYQEYTMSAKLRGDDMLTIKNLPAGTIYVVTEKEANLNGYVTVVSDEGIPLDASQFPLFQYLIEAEKSGGGLIDPQGEDSVTFNNIRYTGDLAVLKSITGEGGFQDTEFEFTAKFTDPYGNSLTSFKFAKYGAELQSGSYANDRDKKFDIENVMTEDGDGLFHFFLNGTQMMTFSDLPNGTTYEINEVRAGLNGYNTTVSRVVAGGMVGTEKHDGTISGVTKKAEGEPSGSADTITYTNDRGAGELTISKTIAGSTADPNRVWEFTVTLVDANGKALPNTRVVNGETLTGYLVNDSWENVNERGQMVLRMRGGESRTITGLPNGTTYTVVEAGANTDGYHTSVAYSDSTGTIATGDTDTVTFTNMRQPGSLSVSKTVRGNAGEYNRLFDFTVTMTAPAGDPLPAAVTNITNESFIDGVSAPEYEELAVSEDGSVTFQLIHGQRIILGDLPEGTTYTVTEAPTSGYSVSSEGAEGVISPVISVAEFVNTANYYGGDDDTDTDDDITRTEENPGPEIPENPVPLTELPNPNEPDSPDTVTILEDDVPTTYVRVPNPENEDEFIYIPEDEVPLQGFEIPETGDSGRTVLWAVLSAASLTGIVVLSVPTGKKKEDEE